MTDTGPLFVSSGDLIADRRYKWALDQAARGDFAGAADILEQTVELAPSFATAWFALGAIRDRLGDRDGAVAAFEKARDADPDDYHGARLQLARLGAGDCRAGDDATPTCAGCSTNMPGGTTPRSPSISHIAARRCCATPSRRCCARRGSRCGLAPCSISAAAPGLPAPPFALAPTGWSASIFRRP